MKKSLLIVLSMMMGLLLVGVAIAGTAPTTGITDSYHDLGTTAAAYGDSTENTTGQNRICVYCHAPHNTILIGDAVRAVDGMGNPVEYLPLWNHNITTMPGFAMYDSGPLQPTPGAIAAGGVQHGLQAVMGQPTGVSILCLSCHDGSVATNAYGTGTSSIGAGDVTMTGRALIGGANATIGGLGDLRNHHPISFDYAQVITDGDTEIRVATSAMGTKTIADYLFGGKLECASCHEVHNGPEAVGIRLTYVDDTRSALCLTCHIK